MLNRFLVLQVFFSFICAAVFGQVMPLPNGFAHNDYLHKRPLLEALDNGYTSIEADIFLHHNKLIVAHYFPFFKKKRTLENLYLAPLKKYVDEHQGKIYANYRQPVVLMIDIKSDANKTYLALKPYLEKYASMLSVYNNNRFTAGKITVVLSGNKPYGMVRNEKRRLAFIDEDLKSLAIDSASNNNLFMLASCKYSRLLKWRGKGRISADEYNVLCDYVTAAHKRGEKVRLWASPENRAVWETLLNCGVDCINTDQLSNLKSYLIAYNKPE